jgi:DNA-binding CsgD family transcriptional regulator
VGRIRYANIVLAEMGITDELGLFLPPVGRSSVALFFDRCSGRFSDADMALADALYPLISGLHQAHVNSVLGVASGMDAEAAISSAKPTRILDRERHEVFRNAAWRRLAEDKAEDLARALAGLNAGAGSQAPFGSRLILHRAALPESFGLAPGGWIDTIEQVGQAPAAPGHPALPPDMARLLTRREQDIVEMILQGYPTTLIAGRLGLSRGTVKNHRQRIYQKLDITTEREIFLSFIAATTSS